MPLFLARPKARAVFCVVLAAIPLAVPLAAHAGCNLIPGTAKTFNGVLGGVDRPFAGPGERLEIRRRPCDTASAGFLPNGSDHVVTLVFKAPDGTNRVVALANDCLGVDTVACAGAPGVASATCRAEPGLATRIDVDAGDRRLVFPFPDTDDDFGPPADDLTLAGPVVIAVTPKVDPLPCQLAADTCATQTGLLACIDALYANDGACGTTVLHDVFSHFTALPVANDYAAGCFQEDPPCTALATEVRATLDADGHLLMPFMWRGILIADQGLPVPRLVRLRAKSPLPFQVPAQVFLGSFTPEGGRLPPILEPQLDPTVVDPDIFTAFGSIDAPATTIRVGRRHGTCVGGDHAGERCGRDVDCDGGTCERSCVDEPATLCPNGTECTTGACGELFDLTPLAMSGGPLVLQRAADQFCQLPPHQDCSAMPGICAGVGNACVAYALEAQSPVPLDGLIGSDDIRTFAFRESIDGVDRNGDGDTIDTVATLRNRATGTVQELGPTAGCGLSTTAEGRAVQRVTDPPMQFPDVATPFRSPAVAADDDVLAFLESEDGQLHCDENGDDDLADGILRVFRLGGGETPLARERAVDGAPKIDGAPLAISNGRVFVRTSEPGNAKPAFERASLGQGAVEPFDALFHTMSRNGRYVLFESADPDLLGPGVDTNGTADLFRRDLQTGTTVRVNVPTGGGESAFAFFGGNAISADGRYVAFTSEATDLLGPGVDTNGARDAFVHDTVTLETQRINLAFGLGQSAGVFSIDVDISDDGRFVVFASAASDLLPPGEDTNGVADVFVRDRELSSNQRVSVGSFGLGVEGNGASGVNTKLGISGNGNVVVFQSDATNFWFGVAFSATYIHDRFTGATEPLAFFDPGFGGNVMPGDLLPACLSYDGQVIVFPAQSDVLLPPGQDTNGSAVDVFVRDRAHLTIERITVATDGTVGSGGTVVIGDRDCISDDGRWVTYPSDLEDLEPSGLSTVRVYMHDRVARTTHPLDALPDGTPRNGTYTAKPAISGDGLTVAFETDASNFVAGTDSNGDSDAYVRGIDPADPLGVDAILFPDGTLDDVVLEAVNATTGAIATLCPADEVSVAAGNAAFLRPESTVGTVTCPGGPLNGDSDTDDDVVQLSIAGGTPQNLGLAATAVKLSPTLVAALADESAQGADLNGDDDLFETVLHVRALGGSSWTNLERAADRFAVSGSRVAFTSAEFLQGAVDLNGDGDLADRVMHVYDHGGSGVRNLKQVSEEEIVIGEPTGTTCGDRHLVAFATPEGLQGDGPLNGDGDIGDAVLQVYDFVTKKLTNVGQATRPCQLEICDPTVPYRVEGASVKFLTFEIQQNEDLDGNGVIGGLVLQRYDACENVVTVIGPVDPETRSDPLATQQSSQVFTTPGGRCSVVPLVACDPEADACALGTFCNPATLVCTLVHPGACADADDCPDGSTCQSQPVVVGIAEADADDDGVLDDFDNCPAAPNPLQEDVDGDGTGDACDLSSHGCPDVPLGGCKAPVQDLKASLQVKDKSPDKGDQVIWKWSKGDATTFADFGTPSASSDVRLCAYDGVSPTLVAGAIAPAAGTCGEKPCWKVTGTDKGYVYGDKLRTPTGVQTLKLKAGEAGKASVLVKAKGELVDVPSLPFTGPVLVQISVDGGACFEAEFQPGAFTKNDTEQFKAKGGAPVP